MDFIMEGNIRRFREMLASETDPAKRATIKTLLNEQKKARPQEALCAGASGGDLSNLFHPPANHANERNRKNFCLVLHQLSRRETSMKVFDSPLAALYFAEREPDLKFAELWEEGRSLCELRKIDLPSGSIWQVTPMAHLPPQA